MPTPLKYTGRLLFITYKSLWGDPIPSLQYIIQQMPKNYGYCQFQIPTFMFRPQHKLIILNASNDPKVWMRPQQQRIYQSCLHVVLKVEFSCSYFFVLFVFFKYLLVWFIWIHFSLIVMESILLNHAKLCSWNQPVLSNEYIEIHSSRKQWEPKMGF